MEVNVVRYSNYVVPDGCSIFGIQEESASTPLIHEAMCS